jgi:hypothetical protein
MAAELDLKVGMTLRRDYPTRRVTRRIQLLTNRRVVFMEWTAYNRKATTEELKSVSDGVFKRWAREAKVINVDR